MKQTKPVTCDGMVRSEIILLGEAQQSQGAVVHDLTHVECKTALSEKLRVTGCQKQTEQSAEGGG